MQSVIPPGDPKRTVVAGKQQGYLGLAINYDRTPCGSPVMRTAWRPSPNELAALVAGAPIVVEILGQPPIQPMMLTIGAVPSMTGEA